MAIVHLKTGRTAFTVDDPRAAVYGTPRKETMLRLAHFTPPGCFVEFGVYQGGSAWRLAAMAKSQGRQCHLFDTFAGMPLSGARDVIPIGAHADVDLPALRQTMPNAIFHVGVFPQTMPADLPPVAFCHVDCDQHASCWAAIDHLWPRMVKGGVMLFDDYNVVDGARQAVDTFFGMTIKRTREGKAYACA